MKIAFSNTLCAELDIETLPARSREWGFDGFELASPCGQPQVRPVEALGAAPDQLRQRLQAAGQTLVALHAGACLPTPDSDSPATPGGRRWIEVAAAAGSRFVVLAAGPASSGLKERRVRRCIEQLGRLAAEGQRRRITVLFENAGSLASSGDAWFVRDASGLPALRLCLNLVNARAAGEPPSVAIPRLAAATSMVHLANATFRPSGAVQRYEPLADGALDLASVLELLKGLAYDGWVCVHYPVAAAGDLPPAEEFLPAAAGYLRRELDRPQVALTAYKGDRHAPRFAPRRPGGGG